MGNSRTFLVQEEDCKLPTDLLGYTTPRFNRKFKEDQWEELCNSISSNIIQQFHISQIQLLPSTSLAIGYFNSFLSKVSKCIFDTDGCFLNKSNIHAKKVLLKILIPNDLSDDIGAKAQVFYKNNNFSPDEIGDSKRPFPIRYFKSESDETILIVDIPTTLSAIRPSINLLIPDNGLGVNPDKVRLERKELENFKKTLTYLINQDDYSKDIITVKWVDK